MSLLLPNREPSVEVEEVLHNAIGPRAKAAVASGAGTKSLPPATAYLLEALRPKLSPRGRNRAGGPNAAEGRDSLPSATSSALGAPRAARPGHGPSGQGPDRAAKDDYVKPRPAKLSLPSDTKYASTSKPKAGLSQDQLDALVVQGGSTPLNSVGAAPPPGPGSPRITPREEFHIEMEDCEAIEAEYEQPWVLTADGEEDSPPKLDADSKAGTQADLTPTKTEDLSDLPDLVPVISGDCGQSPDAADKVGCGCKGSGADGGESDGSLSEYEVDIEEPLLLDPDLGPAHERRSTWDNYSLDRLNQGGDCVSPEKAGAADKGFTKFQAILTDLPKHALASPEAGTLRSCGCGVAESLCPGPAATPDAPALSCACAVELALVEAIHKYPQYSEELSRLVVAHASPDLSIFADNERQLLFTSIRGTCPTSGRDLGNDALIVFGVTPARVYYARHTYSGVRRLYPKYRSYGCGHSLGGSIMHDLAHSLEEDPELAFERVDVFNAGGSPFRRNYSALHATEFNAHRVAGDLVSYFYLPPGGGGNSRGGRTIQHDSNPNIWAHGLGHFLPRRRTTLGRFMCRGFNVMWGGWLSCTCIDRTGRIR